MPTLLLNSRGYYSKQPQTPTAPSLHGPGRGLVLSWTPVCKGAMRPGGAVSSTIGSMTFAKREVGAAIVGAYQGTNNYEKIERNALLSFTGPHTYETLIKVTAFQTTVYPYITGIISQFQSASGYGSVLRFNDDATIGHAAYPVFFILQGHVEKHATGSALNTNVIYHLVGTYTGSAIRLYINGVLVAETSASGAVDNETDSYVSLMSDYTNGNDNSSNRCLNGEMYLARVYNVGKTASEVLSLYQNAWCIYKTNRLLFTDTAAATPVPKSFVYSQAVNRAALW